jgi:hypothetical protein
MQASGDQGWNARLEEHEVRIATLRSGMERYDAHLAGIEERLRRDLHAKVDESSRGVVTQSDLHSHLRSLPSAEDLVEMVHQQIGGHLQLQQTHSKIEELQNQLESHQRIHGDHSKHTLSHIEMIQRQLDGMSSSDQLAEVLHVLHQRIHSDLSKHTHSKLETVQSQLDRLERGIPCREQLAEEIHQRVHGDLSKHTHLRLETLQSQLDKLAGGIPCREQLAEELHQRIHGSLSQHTDSRLEELQSQMDKLDRVVVPSSELAREVHEKIHADVSRNTDSKLERLQNQLDSLAGVVETIAGRVDDAGFVLDRESCAKFEVLHGHISEMVTTRAMSEAAIEDLRAQLDSLPTSDQLFENTREQLSQVSQKEEHDALAVRMEGLERGLQVIGAAVHERMPEVLSSSSSLHQRVTEMVATREEDCKAHGELRKRVDEIPSLQKLDDRIREHIALQPDKNAQVFAALEERLFSLAQQVQMVGTASTTAAEALDARLHDILESQETGHLRSVEVAQDVQFESLLQKEQLATEVQDLRRQFANLSLMVEDRVMVSVQTLQSQVPELLHKVDRLVTEQTERFEKVEENDVKLSLSATKLSACEQRVQDCMGMVERVPSMSDMKTQLQDMFQRILQDLNVPVLQKRLDLSLDAIEELNEEQQFQKAQLLMLRKQLSMDEFTLACNLAAELRAKDGDDTLPTELVATLPADSY